MRRREFIAAIGAAAAWPLGARAQQPERMRRIGVLQGIAEEDLDAQARVKALRQGLEKLGWNEGANLTIDFRYAGGDLARIRSFAAELVALKPDVLVASTATPLSEFQRQTKTIPIVFATASDPIASGFVASLARPGGNITGFALYEIAIGGKWLELLKQVVPSLARVGILYSPLNPAFASYIRTIEGVAPSFGAHVLSVPISNAADIERAFREFAGQSIGGLIVLPSAVTSAHRNLIIALAARHRLPATYPLRHYAISGGLVSYGVDNIDLHRRAATYVDRILKGEKPADLPVQQADKFQLVINLKTAKALGLDVPVALLARTDEVIE